MDATELLVWGALIHLVVDWLGQNLWVAAHKSDLRHPSGYLHAGVHGLAMLIIFPPLGALSLAIAHLLIDTREPLRLWSRVMTQPQDDSPMAVSVHIWRDQTLHLATIGIAALIFAS